MTIKPLIIVIATGLITLGCGPETGSKGSGSGGEEDATATGSDPGTTTGGEDVEPDPVDIIMDADAPDPPNDEGGSGDELPEVEEPDEGTTTGIDIPPVEPGAVEVVLNGADVTAAHSEIPLPAIPPGPTAKTLIPIQVYNVGAGPLEILKVVLEPLNEDGTGKSVWVSAAPDPASLAPVTLEPGGELTFDIVYTPQFLDENDATLRIVTADPALPVIVVQFLGPPIEPRIRIEPPTWTFELSSLTVAEERVFEIHNDGLAPLVIGDIEFLGEPANFVVVEKPDKNALVKPFGSPNYKPKTLVLAYKPSFGVAKESATLTIDSNDPTLNPAPLLLDSTFETDATTSPCLFAYDTEALGLMDLGDATAGEVKAKITALNVGEATCTIQSLSLTNDPAGIWYSLDVNGNVPVAVLPITFNAGETVEITVHYQAPGFAVNSELTIAFTDPDSDTKLIPIKGAGPKPCIDIAPGTLDTPFPVQFGGPKFTNLERQVMIYNCGAGTLGLLSAEIVDAGGVFVSDFWTLLNPPVGYLSVPPFGVRQFNLAMYASADPVGELAGVLEVEYVTQQGPTKLAVPLVGDIVPLAEVPTAVAKVTAQEGPYLVGQTLTLDGSESATFSPAPSLMGYNWYLVNKPVGSEVLVNGLPGFATKSVVPDLPGNYTFALVVETDAPIQSKPSTVVVQVEEPPEEGGMDGGADGMDGGADGMDGGGE